MKQDSTNAVVIEDETEDAASATSASATTIVVDDETEDKKAKLPARAVRKDDGTISLPLLEEVSLTIKTGSGTKTVTYSELIFYRMKGIDLRLIGQAPAEKQTIVALARATRMSTPRMDALFDQMDGRDVTAAVAVITFLQE